MSSKSTSVTGARAGPRAGSSGRTGTSQRCSGTARPVTSDQVNARLAELVGDAGATAKTFRTWNGSVAALEAALAEERPTVRSLSQAAAARLHNTPAVARGSYIHPRVIELASDDAATRALLTRNLPPVQGLRQPERALLRLLEG